MLRINFKKSVIGVLEAVVLSAGVFALSSILFPNESMAAESGVFQTLIDRGTEIFTGMRQIIFAVSGFGIIAVAIGGFFGNLNWKWLAAIGIGLFVLSSTAAIIDYMVGQRPGSIQDVQSGLKSGK
jgi:type IV secretory pathway VirB2 component (pilin)